MWNTIKSRIKRFWNGHVVGEFPYPHECWDCRKGSCENCHILRRYKL